MDLDGTIKTPVGPVSKKVAVSVGIAVVALGGIVWYRHKNAPASSGTIPEAQINPATGYAYGSPEDAAALAQQSAYVSPAGSGGGGSSASSDTPIVATNNQQWVQNVLSYMQNNGVITDAGPMASSLGKYVTGAYVSDSDVANIQQAIAVEGHPPVAGASGYPPSLNRTPVASGNPSTPATSTGKPTAILWRKTYPAATSIETQFAGGTNTNLYEIYVNGHLWSHVTGTGIGPFSFTIPNLKRSTRYSIMIQPIGANGQAGPTSTSTVTTKKA